MKQRRRGEASMFHQLTTDLSNRKAMNEDIISELPDDLLLQILSSLPTENAIATSVLSKRWRSLWKMVPKLKFHQVSENVYRSLTLHTAPLLESLHLESESRTDWLDVGSWIATAFARRVRKLVLVCFRQDPGLLLLPSVLFTYNDTLEILKLKYSIGIVFPSRVCLKSLRKLCLYGVDFKDEESVSNLFCGCPSLEDLAVHRSTYYDVPTFTIAVPSLQRLTLEELNIVSLISECYVINAPALKYLVIRGLFDIESCLIEKAPELLEAKLSNVSRLTDDNILESLTSAKRLTLHLSRYEEITVPTGKIFDQLVYLELLTHKRRWWELLLIMLGSSPKLQILKLTNLNVEYEVSMWDYLQWNPPKCVPECLLFHLETFVWIGYNWQREDEKEVATYILENAQCLKKATFSEFTDSKNFEEKDSEKLKKNRREMLNELASVVRASDSCHLVFESV